MGDGSRRARKVKRGSSPFLPFNLGWKILTWFEGHGNSMAKENDQDK